MITDSTIPPTRKTIEIRITSLHWEKCRALVYGQLAVVCLPQRPRSWTVTHVASGMCVASFGYDYQYAHQFAKAIEGIYDFDWGYDTYEKTGSWPDAEGRRAVKAIWDRLIVEWRAAEDDAQRGESEAAK